MIADLIDQAALGWLATASQVDAGDGRIRRAGVTLQKIAAVTRVHGLAGLHGYMACFRYSVPNDQPSKAIVLETVNRLLDGDHR